MKGEEHVNRENITSVLSRNKGSEVTGGEEVKRKEHFHL